jgi:hypothetical protein
LSKLEIVSAGDVGDVEGLVSILGVELFISRLNIWVFLWEFLSRLLDIIEKMEHRLAGWKRLYLREEG